MSDGVSAWGNASGTAEIDADRLSRIARVLLLLLPVALFYARSVAEVLIALIGVAFLVHSARHRRWEWLGTLWVKATLCWWLWLVFCSSFGAAGMPGLVQALVAIRLPLLAAAAGFWLLSNETMHRRLFLVLTICAAWLIQQTWQQYLFGVNIWGLPRYSNAVLTGPFTGLPRSGTAMVLFFFPVAFVWANRLSLRAGWAGKLLPGLLVTFMLVTMVLIGQRMPLVLTLFGLVLMAWALPEARRLALPALAMAVVVVALTPFISPLTFQKVVVQFGNQLAHFPTSDYGMLYQRAIVIINAHPIFGGGHDAFRTLCSDPTYFHGLSWLGTTDAESGGIMGCNLHPHNFYLEATTAGGYPGLILFAAMTGTMVWSLFRSARQPSASQEIRVFKLALLVQITVAFWPIAAAADFVSLPNAGWDFLMLGWGVALSQRGRG